MPGFEGVYELAEASRYLHATAPQKPPHYSTFRRWVRSGLTVPEAPPIPAKGLFITFEDLVSLRMVVALRVAGFSLQHIRRVHRWLKDTTGYPRPFALRDLWISETDIFIEMENLLSVTRGGQYAMEFIKEWLSRLRRPLAGSLDLAFRRVDGKEVACSWMPHSHVSLNPLIHFGAPCIEGTRIPTTAVWAMFLGGDKPEAIARDYGLPLIKVQSSLEWEKKIANLVS
ncbi:MAG: DUF433 domain-containing protein [Dehalococcoidia bacterium]|nr:hypothetical protein [Chloroflexota bacterium]MBT9159855.1 hypothetical protein [Chloroflexota bacterium]MBT9162187.1 hypothetical protein [Chloroflexota bacterium]